MNAKYRRLFITIIIVLTLGLAKHDENYMPPEVADALKKNNVWKGDSD